METETIRVRKIHECREFHVPSSGITLKQGDLIILETEEGLECCCVTRTSDKCIKRIMPEPEGTVLRKATPNDIEWIATMKNTENQAAEKCRELIENLKLNMVLVHVKLVFDGSKLVFFFTANDRIDFRVLVRELARLFHVRIEMRQIGVRDKSRTVGGVAICGRELCCSLYLKDFVPVTMKMAKEQNLTLSPNKISGCCGRLLCCLAYENDAYQEARVHLPTIGSKVKTPSGVGIVRNMQILNGVISVILDSGGYVNVKADEIVILKLADEQSYRGRKRGNKPKKTEESEEVEQTVD